MVYLYAPHMVDNGNNQKLSYGAYLCLGRNIVKK